MDVTKLNGRYISDKSENFEEYMKEAGVGLLTRKAAANLKVTIEIKTDGKHFTALQFSTFKNTSLEFNIGEEFEETTPDGRKFKSLVKIEGDKLVHYQNKIKDSDKDSKITRYMEDENTLVTILECGNVVCKRFYKRE